MNLFTFDGFKKANDELKEMDFKNFTRFDYDELKYYFNKSNFYFFDEEHNNINDVQKEFNEIENPDKIVFFYFILAQTDKKEQCNVDLYLALYSNKIGIIYDLILGTDTLSDIFKSLFCDFCLVPFKKRDRKNLSYLIDLSDNYFLNSSYIAAAYQNECFQKVVEENVLNRIDQKYKKPDQKQKYSKNLYFQTMIRLIVYYAPLIGIISDNLKLSPLNYEQKSLPIFNKDDFDEIFPIGSNSFEISNIVLYRKTFEFYTSNIIKEEYKDKFYIQKNFFNKVYKKGEIPFIVPCYGTIESRGYRGYESPKGLLLKFICNGKITDIKGRTNYAMVKYWDDTTKSLNMYRLLISITTMQEFGYYHRNVKPDHIFLDNENKAYFGGIATICDLNNTENETIGSELYSSPEQYRHNISSPHSDIYSFGVNCYYIINNGIISTNDKFSTKYEKLNLLLNECTRKNPDSRPDAFVLFTQMYTKNLFLPKTNQVLIDELFYSTYRQYLETPFTDGKYLSKWSESFEKSHFKNMILNNLKDMFIIKFSCTELEAKFNRALFDDDLSDANLFLIEYDIMDIFYVNFFANELGNLDLAQKTNELIESAPIAAQIINKLILYYKLNNEIDDPECDYIINLIFKEIDNFAEKFDECILLASEFYISPEFILKSIIERKNLKLPNSHNTISYILQVGPEIADVETVCELLSHFEEISISDINKLKNVYGTEISKKFTNAKKNVDYDDLLQFFEKSLTEIEKIESEADKEEQDDTYSNDYKEFFDIIDKINSDQDYIEPLTRNLENDSKSEND